MVTHTQHTMMEGRLKRMAVFPAKLGENRTNSVSGAVKVRTMTVMMFLLLLVECLDTSTNARASRLWCFLFADAGTRLLNPQSSKQEDKPSWLVLRLGQKIWNLDHSLAKFRDGSSFFLYLNCLFVDTKCLELLEEGMKDVPRNRIALQMGDDAMRQFLISRQRDLIQYPITVHFIECMNSPLVFDQKDSSCRGGSALFDPKIEIEKYFTEFLAIFELQSEKAGMRERCLSTDFSIPENVDVFGGESKNPVLSGPGRVRAEIEGLKIVTPGDKQNATGAISNASGESEHVGEHFYHRLVLRRREDGTQVTALQCGRKLYPYDFQRGGPLSLISKGVELTLPYKREVVVNRHEIRILGRSFGIGNSFDRGRGGDRIICYVDGLGDPKRWAENCVSMVERYQTGNTKSYIVASDSEEAIGEFLNRMYLKMRGENRITAEFDAEMRQRFRILLVKEDRDEHSPANRSGNGFLQSRTSSLSVWESFYPVVAAVGWKIEYTKVTRKAGPTIVDVSSCYGSLELRFETRKWELSFENGEVDQLAKAEEDSSVTINFTLTKMYLTTESATGAKKTKREITGLQNLVLNKKFGKREKWRKTKHKNTLTLICQSENVLFNRPTKVKLRYIQLEAKTNHESLVRK